MRAKECVPDPCSDQQLVDMANEWSIEGKDLISEVTCREPYEWKDLTDEEWEFSKAAKARMEHDPFHVRPCVVLYDAFCGTWAAPCPGNKVKALLMPRWLHMILASSRTSCGGWHPLAAK